MKRNKLFFYDDHVEIVVESKTHGTHNIIVDVEDLELVSAYRWNLCKKVSKTSGDVSFYAISKVKKEDGGWRGIQMHRIILGLDFGDKRWTDHINYKTLDNRRCNLRSCSHSESVRHRRKTSGTSSKYKGVWFSTKNKNWTLRIMVGGKMAYLGSFKTQKEAAIQYDVAAFAEFGEFAELNFPEADHSKDNFDIEKYKTPFQKKKSSKYVGVSWCRKAGKWAAGVTIAKKQINLGYFKNEEDAAKARDDYVIKHKLKGTLNFEVAE